MKPTAKICLLFLIFLCFQTVNAEWKKFESHSLAWFYDIYFLDANKGWIAGSNGELLATKDGGKTWIKQQIFTRDNVKEVHFIDEKNGWLLCDRDKYNLGSNPPSYLLNTTDGGETWKKVNFTGGARNRRVANIFFSTKNNFGIAVGESGSVFAMQNNESDWTLMPSPVRYLLVDGVFTDDFSGTIVGGGGTILFTEDAGASWKPATIWGKVETKLNSVFYINQKTGWAVGANGKIYQTINGGKRWRTQHSTTSKELNDIFFKDTAEGWIVGDDGTILHSTTAGNVWMKDKPITKHKLEKILFVGERGWAVGFGGTILFYD